MPANARTVVTRPIVQLMARRVVLSTLAVPLRVVSAAVSVPLEPDLPGNRRHGFGRQSRHGMPTSLSSGSKTLACALIPFDPGQVQLISSAVSDLSGLILWTEEIVLLREPKKRVGPARGSERYYLESLIRADYERCHPGETLEDMPGSVLEA
jgi:hypothetical protein